MIKRKKLENYLNSYLNIYDFQDYGPNGLQIEGKDQIKTLAFAVSATKHSVEKAISLKADGLIVHHGLFWKFHGAKTITGAFAKRVKPLIENQINLFGYHLPLDAHMEVGNAKTIADFIGLEDLKPFGDHKGSATGVMGKLSQKIKASELKEKLHNNLQHNIIHSSPNDEQMISRVGIITGGANSDWILAKRKGLDAYITGEISEHDWHEAKESGIHFYAGGHNATEQFGVQALMKKIKVDYPEIEVHFIESENPA